MSRARKTPKNVVRSSRDASLHSDEASDAWLRISAEYRRKWAEMTKPSTPTKLIPKPLASYRLGYLSFALWMWHKVFWETPRDESTWGGVPLAVEQLRESRLALADEIHPNVFGELERVLNDLDHMARTLVAAWQETGTYRGTEFGSRVVPGAGHWEELRQLADRALAGDHRLRPWFDYGAAAGAYQLALWDYEPDPGGEGDPERLPDIRPVVQRAGMLPEAQVRQIPLLWSLVEMAPILESDGQGPFLEEFLERNRGVWDYYFGKVDIPTIHRMAFTLDDAVQEGLEALESEQESRAPATTIPDALIDEEPTNILQTSLSTPSPEDYPKPHWIRERGELWVGKTLVRVLAEQAVNEYYILD